MIRFNPHLKARIIILTSHWTTGGFSLEIHVMDECTRHDSSCVTEIIARGLERVQEICQRRGRGVPTRLVVCGDNTVGELKNQINLTYISALVSKRKMRLSALAFLRKSHTHDRLDQIFGILARRIASEDRLMDPSDTIRIITTELSRPGLRSWIGNSTELHVQKLDAVRAGLWDFTQWGLAGRFHRKSFFPDDAAKRLGYPNPCIYHTNHNYFFEVKQPPQMGMVEQFSY